VHSLQYKFFMHIIDTYSVVQTLLYIRVTVVFAKLISIQILHFIETYIIFPGISQSMNLIRSISCRSYRSY
jgi:hypothetical protein